VEDAMVRLQKWLVLGFVGCAMLSLTPIAAQAQSYCDRITDPLRRGNCYAQEAATQEQQRRWNSYTPRQKALARAVEQVVYGYYQRTGQALPVTQQTLAQVMRIVGAARAEATFVVDRMVANRNAIAAINQADREIDRMQRFLNCLQTQDTGCVP
jgi:hypothetical protein